MSTTIPQWVRLPGDIIVNTAEVQRVVLIPPLEAFAPYFPEGRECRVHLIMARDTQIFSGAAAEAVWAWWLGYVGGVAALGVNATDAIEGEA